MPDALFADPRLARLYDVFDNPRPDLDHYHALLVELGATSVLDVGCGTGRLAHLLADNGFTVIGVDPAAASLAVARSKPGADRIRWIDGDAAAVTERGLDAAVMTGNVAQVFTTDESWSGTLTALADVVRPNGHLIFEVRDPARQAWLEWTPDRTRKEIDVPDIGPVTTWTEVTDVSLPLVSFTATYRFSADDLTLTSSSTLRFRQRDEVSASLAAAGFSTDEVRDAPDRPGKEFVFVARRTAATDDELR
ncbi:MAG: class I SAM-dependent methyltransferase [Actinomycetota bacterium]